MPQRPPPLTNTRPPVDIFAPTGGEVAPESLPVESSTRLPIKQSDGRRVVSYKIRPEIARRLRKLAHNQDRPIGQVAEQALLEFLERNGG